MIISLVSDFRCGPIRPDRNDSFSLFYSSYYYNSQKMIGDKSLETQKKAKFIWISMSLQEIKSGPCYACATNSFCIGLLQVICCVITIILLGFPSNKCETCCIGRITTSRMTTSIKQDTLAALQGIEGKKTIICQFLDHPGIGLDRSIQFYDPLGWFLVPRI